MSENVKKIIFSLFFQFFFSLGSTPSLCEEKPSPRRYIFFFFLNIFQFFKVFAIQMTQEGKTVDQNQAGDVFQYEIEFTMKASLASKFKIIFFFKKKNLKKLEKAKK